MRRRSPAFLQRFEITATLFGLALALFTAGCGTDGAPDATTASDSDQHANGQHAEEGGEHGDHAEGAREMIVLSPASLGSLDLETVAVRDLPVGATLDFPARVVPVPDREAMVTTLLAGRIEEVYVNEGDRVQSGQAVARVTGPQLGDLVAELRHTRADLDRQVRLSERGVGIEKNRIEARTAFDAARQHLRAIGLSPEEIEDIATGAHDAGGVHLRAPIGGLILARKATVGGPVSPGDVLFHIAQLAPIWVEADVYERDLAAIRHGMGVQVRSVSGSAGAHDGVIHQILPNVDAERRVATVRVQLPNQGQALKPGMYATVSVAAAGEAQPSLPVDAVLTDGTQSYVIVAENDSTFRRIEIAASADAAGHVPVPELEPGSRVVTTGAFQIHSAMQGVEAGHAH